MRSAMPTDPDPESDVVIVGGSLAAARTALALRAEDYQGGILLVSAETEPPYDRPPLSKRFLGAAMSAAELTLLSADRAQAAGIRLILGRAATALDPARRRVTLDDGGRLRYGTLVIATGAQPRRLPGTAAGVRTLRSLADAVSLRLSLRSGSRLAIVGAGLIGGEVASTARAQGTEVTLIDVSAAPMSGLLGSEVGDLLARRYRDHGVTVHFGAGVVRLGGQPGAMAVDLSDGTRVEADTVLAAIGVTPATGWLAGSGLDLADGVGCDEFGRAAGRPDIYAVGDVARWYQPDVERSVRFEDWTSVHNQAGAVAHTIASPGDPRPVSAPRYGWTEQFGLRIQLVGRLAAGAERSLIGSSADPECLLQTAADGDGRLVWAVSVGWPRAMVECRRAIKEGRSVAEVVDRIPHTEKLLAASC
jgi:NADPH-dependent 2,4-dienoyl-CoA reductase/sulfur reductase-like enzyme